MHTAFLSLTVVFVILVVLALCDCVISGYLYPLCPYCNGNLNSRRLKIFSREGICSVHGRFMI